MYFVNKAIETFAELLNQPLGNKDTGRSTFVCLQDKKATDLPVTSSTRSRPERVRRIASSGFDAKSGNWFERR
jgi:hypothetical protein